MTETWCLKANHTLADDLLKCCGAFCQDRRVLFPMWVYSRIDSRRAVRNWNTRTMKGQMACDTGSLMHPILGHERDTATGSEHDIDIADCRTACSVTSRRLLRARRPPVATGLPACRSHISSSSRKGLFSRFPSVLPLPSCSRHTVPASVQAPFFRSPP